MPIRTKTAFQRRGASCSRKPAFETSRSISAGCSSKTTSKPRATGAACAKPCAITSAWSTDPAVRLQPEEIRDHRWATLDEARKLITYAESRRLLEEAARALGII